MIEHFPCNTCGEFGHDASWCPMRQPTLRQRYAMVAPDVPSWFAAKTVMPSAIDTEEVWEKYHDARFFEWRWYFAARMIETEGKK